MMIALIIMLGFIVAGLAVGMIAAATAPVGYEDEAGFHYGPKQGTSEEGFTCGVHQPKLA